MLSHIGGPAPVTATGGGAQADLTIPTSSLPERGVRLGRLSLVEVAGTGFGYGSEITLGGDSLASGYWPIEMFDPEAVGSPGWGHRLAPNRTLTIGVTAITTGDYACGFTVADEDAPEVRSLIVLGQDAAPSSLAAGGTREITISPEEPGILGRLFAGNAISTGSIDDVTITSAKVNGRELWSGTLPAGMFKGGAALPGFEGFEVNENTRISFTVQNNHATAAVGPVFAFSMI